MYTIEVQHEFCAAHALTIAGAVERIHGHNFRILATIESDEPDRDGLVCDFHTAHEVLVQVCEPFTNGSLNAAPPFDSINPTAEHLARHIADALAQRLDDSIHPARVRSVRVTEAPGCASTYTRPR